jgi:hypothetical protein
MSINNNTQFNIAKNQNELLFADLLKQGYISISALDITDKQIIPSCLDVNHILDENIDKKFHVDIKSITHNYEEIWYDVKQRELPTSYINYSITKDCFLYFNDLINDKPLYNLYYFAFILDNGSNYLNDFLVVKTKEVINLNHIDNDNYILYNINDIKHLPSARIFKPDF